MAEMFKLENWDIERKAGRSFLAEWSAHQMKRGVAPVIVILAEGLACSADDLTEALNLKVDRRIQKFGDLASVARWEEMFRRPDRMMESLLNSIGGLIETSVADEPIGLGTLLRWFEVSARAVERMARKTPSTLMDMLIETQKSGELNAAIAEGLRWRELFRGLMDEDEQLIPDRVAQSVEMQFVLRVWWPCWCRYQMSSRDLFLQAVSGRPDAVEKLLSLDLRNQQIPCINAWFSRWEDIGNQDACAIVARAMEPSRERRSSPNETKLLMMAFILELQRQLKYGCRQRVRSLTIEELRGALDAAAKDKGGGIGCDEALPQSCEALRRALTRAMPREHWKRLGHGLIKPCPNVDGGEQLVSPHYGKHT